MAHTTLLEQKFRDPFVTAKGETRGSVDWRGLKTLWLNTGTLCNIECRNCYIKSSPKNDDLVYLTLEDVTPFLDEIDALGEGAKEIGITGGEPFMCPDILKIMEAVLARGHSLLVLTNAMRPMMRARIREGLLALNAQYGDRIVMRVSMDHHSRPLHDAERGQGSFDIACEGMTWLAESGFSAAIAGRQDLAESEAAARHGYGELIARLGLNIDPADPKTLVLFPEMLEGDSPPEITTACWGILDVDPADMMCASQRMLVRRKGAGRATVTACTLLAYAPEFELGDTLAAATEDPVQLNHPWCATFCVLGGASCSA
ncbi:radical SAM protein [Henriciella marina]|uniref:radical SAM protein n=1 Tax=Henriciella marina TaxID=453851 RepID=UPI0003671FFE|nr:radical SAM protein [Henriciella marina]